MNQFKREPRYIVFKIKDIEAYLPPGSMDAICHLGNAIHEGRMAAGKAPFNAVVVEQGWPEFEPTWAAIESRVARDMPCTCYSEPLPGGGLHLIQCPKCAAMR